MQTFTVNDGAASWEQDIDAATADEALENIAFDLDTSCYDIKQYGEHSFVLRLTVTRMARDKDGDLVDTDDWARRVLAIDPDEPDCEIDDTRYDEHDWDEYSNRGNGGGIIAVDYCRSCGVYRTTNTWASLGGEEGVATTIQYDEPDDDSSLRVAKKVISAHADAIYAVDLADGDAMESYPVALWEIIDNRLENDDIIEIANDLRDSNGKRFRFNDKEFDRR